MTYTTPLTAVIFVTNTGITLPLASVIVTSPVVLMVNMVPLAEVGAVPPVMSAALTTFVISTS